VSAPSYLLGSLDAKGLGKEMGLSWLSGFGNVAEALKCRWGSRFCDGAELGIAVGTSVTTFFCGAWVLC